MSLKKTLLPATLASCLIYNASGSLLQNPTNQKIQIQGANLGDHLGYSVSGAGDVNGDGFDDIIFSSLSSPFLVSSSLYGKTYVLFGSETGLFEVDLDNLTSTQGFSITDATRGSGFGYSVSGAGDVNGDGLDDVIIGSLHSANDAGTAYVIFGSKAGLPNINVTNITSSQGFKIIGGKQDKWLGTSVSSAGDVNGDGIDDVIVGAPYSSTNGAAYVIYGSNKTISDIDLDNFDKTQGFRINGQNSPDTIGFAVSGAGDVNADGIDDVLVGAPGITEDPSDKKGAVYVIFGEKERLSDVDVSNLTSSQGTKIVGVGSQDSLGNSVSRAGDVNGDGIDDIIIGANGASPLERQSAGIAYVLFGNSKGFSSIELENLTNAEGFRIMGAVSQHHIGASVSGAGDVNGDGVDDLIVGAPSANGSEEDPDNSGEAFVIYGSHSGVSDVDLAQFNSSQGMRFTGDLVAGLLGSSVNGAGDVNGDGISDLIIGAPANYNRDHPNGVVEVVLGQRSEELIVF